MNTTGKLGGQAEEGGTRRGDLSHRFVLQCVEQWRAKGLPMAPLAMMFIAHGTAIFCELEDDETCAAYLRSLADGLGEDFAGGHG